MTEVGVEQHTGTAEELHLADPFADGAPAAPAVWVCAVTAPAIVLGSRQTPDVVDAQACREAGLQVTRRRSGGGAVLVRPHAVAWIDVITPHGVMPDDVRGSMVWVGGVWRDALVGLGADPARLAVHDGPMVCTPWSKLVCFAGVGPGEVLVDGRKLVGLSQRRTRHGIRVQCQIHRHPLLVEMRGLFGVHVPEEAIVEPAVLGELVTVSDTHLAAAVATLIEERITLL